MGCYGIFRGPIGPTGPAGPAGSDATADYVFGASQVINGTSHLAVGAPFAASIALLTNTSQDTVQFAGVLQDFRIRHAPAGGITVITYDLLVNGVSQLTLASTSNTALVSDMVSTIAVNAGDALGIQVQQASGTGVGCRPVFRFRNVGP